MTGIPWIDQHVERTKKKDYLKNRFLAELDPQQGRAAQAEDFYLGKATTFDPTAALEKYGQSAYNQFQRGLKYDVGELRGQQVGMGRLDTGFATEDEDRLVLESGNRFRDALAGQALTATGMEMENYQNVGAYGANQRGTYLDMLSGALDRETAEKNAKKKFWSDLLGAGFGLAGKALGGGVG